MVKEAILKHLWWATFVVALLLLVAHSFDLATVKVDSNSILLLVLMLISPFIAAVRKIKFGDFEAEIDPKEVQKVKEAAEAAQSETPPENVPEIHRTANDIREISKTDPVLGLAKLRIELEKVLRKVSRSIDRPTSDPGRPLSLGSLVHRLSSQEVIPSELAGPLREVISIANRAVHGESIASDDAEEIVEVGTSLLVTLYWHTAQLLHGHVLEETPISPDELRRYETARYRLTTVVPVVGEPRRVVRGVSQEQLDEYLEGYYEFAEFVVGVEEIPAGDG
jgi:hypothetical protein